MTSEIKKPLSEKPLGYVVAVLGGFLGGPIGLLTSPGVLFLLTKIMPAKDGKQPNRFLVWALIGIVGSPLSLAPFLPSKNKITPSTATQTQTSQSETVSLVPLGVEEAVKDDRSVAVRRSEVFSSISSSNQFLESVKSKGGKLVAVYMDIKNTGNESGNMFWSQFELKDDQGRVYKDIEDFTEIMTINDWAKEQGLADKGDQLFPGATAKTVLVFRVAPNAKGLYLVANDNTSFKIK